MDKPDIVEHYEQMKAAGGGMYFDPVELDEIFHYYIEHGTGQDATEVLDLAKSLHPEDEVTKRMTVEYLLNEDEAAEALTLLDTFFDERASFHCILRSAALAKLGRLSEAMELARLVSTEYEDENDEDESYISYDLGLGFMNAGEYAIALCYFEDSRKRHPEDIKTLTGILYCNNQLGIREGQEELADRIIKIDPFHYEAWLTKGNLLALKDKFAEAYDAFDYAIAIMPDEADAYIHKCNILQYENKTKEAEEVLKEAVSKVNDTTNAHLHIMLAHIIGRTKKNKNKAIKHVWKSLECAPLNVQTLMQASFAFKDLGAYTEQLTMLRAANEKKPKDLDILSNMVEAYNCVGLFEDATDICEEIINIEESAAGYAMWGSCLISLSNYGEAYRKFKKANEIEPMWQTYLLMAACDIELNRFAEMEKNFRLAYSLNPDGAIELFDKISPDIMQQMNENGFLKRLHNSRERAIRKEEFENYVKAEVERRLSNK